MSFAADVLMGQIDPVLLTPKEDHAQAGATMLPLPQP
jgi:hypothetical protein